MNQTTQPNQTEYVTSLLRQVLNEKGMYETVTALLASLPPERKREIAEALLDPSGFGYSSSFREAAIKYIEPALEKAAQELSSQIEAGVRAHLASRMPDLLKDAQERAERKVNEAIDKVFEPLKRNAYGYGR